MSFPAISPQQAFADYVSLGANRSLAKLHQSYAAHTPYPPAYDTLKSWSRRFNWQKQLQAHNDNVLQQISVKLAATEANTFVALAVQCQEVAAETLRRCIKAAEKMDIQSWADVRRMQQIACEMITTSAMLHRQEEAVRIRAKEAAARIQEEEENHDRFLEELDWACEEGKKQMVEYSARQAKAYARVGIKTPPRQYDLFNDAPLEL